MAPIEIDDSHAREVIGNCAIWCGAMICFIGSQFVADVIWKDSKLMAKAIKRFRHIKKKTGKDDFSAFYDDHPATVSEMLGDPKSPTGSMGPALVMPGLILWIGGCLQVASVPSPGSTYSSLIITFVRLLSAPVGLMMIINTPVRSLGKRSAAVGISRPSSEYETAAGMSTWFLVHNIGAAVMGLPLVPIELPSALWAIWDFHYHLQNDPNVDIWTKFGVVQVHYARVLFILLSLTTGFHFVSEMAKRGDPNGQRMRSYKIYTFEFTMLLSILWLNLLSSHLFVINPTRAFTIITQEAFWANPITYFLFGMWFWYGSYKIFWVHGRDSIWFDQVDWAGRMQKRQESSWSPLVKGLARLAGEDKESKKSLAHGLWTMCIVQAGVAAKVDRLASSHIAWKASVSAGIGGNMPKLRQFLIYPRHAENLQAIEIDDLSVGDLEWLNKYICQAAKLLPGADTLYIPLGSTAKYNRSVPLLYLSCTSHSAAVKALDDQTEPTDSPVQVADNEVGIDITERVLSSEAGSFLAKTPFLEALQQPGGCQALWSYFCCLMDAQSVRLPHEELDLGSMTHTPAWYEVQVRNICSPQPQFVLRTLRDLVPSLVWHMAEASPCAGTMTYNDLWKTAAPRTQSREKNASAKEKTFVSPYPDYMVKTTSQDKKTE